MTGPSAEDRPPLVVPRPPAAPARLRLERAGRRAWETYEAVTGGTRRWEDIPRETRDIWVRVALAAKRSR